MEAFDSLEQPLCDYNESMDALPELWETDSFESVSELDISSPPICRINKQLITCELPLTQNKLAYVCV